METITIVFGLVLAYFLGFYSCLAFLSTLLKKAEVKIAEKKTTVQELNPNKWE
jgi:hypothetical protein